MTSLSSSRRSDPLDGSIWKQMRSYLALRYGWVLFLGVFVLPTVVAGIYYGLIASDRYVSESQFLVRSVDKPAAEGMSAHLRDFGISRANDDAYAIQEYLYSRDAMQALMRKVNLRAVYTRAGADPVTRYHAWGRDTDETFYRYFKQQITVQKNDETGITGVTVSAYRAADAKAIVDALVTLSEERINVLNIRSRRDTLVQAQQTLAQAETGLTDATLALTRYRNASENINPMKSAGAAIDRGATLRRSLAMLQVNLQTMLAKAPANPAIPAVRQRIAALESQIAQQQDDLTGGTDGLAQKLGDFEELTVRQELAAKVYEGAQAQMETARQDAIRQQIYIETIVRPNLPDEALEPRRWRYFLTVALLGLWSFLMLYLLASGSRDHLNLD
jgi:capsular polysaccharide transport system permease protein